MAIPSVGESSSYSGKIKVQMFQSEQEGLQVTIVTDHLSLRSVTYDDVGYYQELFEDPETMRHYADGNVRDAAFTANRVNEWIHRWKEGDPFSALAIFMKGTDQFCGYIVAGHGADLGLDEDSQAGYSEMVGLSFSPCWSCQLEQEAAAAVVKGLIPKIQARGYRVNTEDLSTKEVQERPLKWLVATCKTSLDEGVHTATIKILKGLGFECQREEEKYGAMRGIFALKV